MVKLSVDILRVFLPKLETPPLLPVWEGTSLTAKPLKKRVYVINFKRKKKKTLRESTETHPNLAEYFRELAVDFCVRSPEEATKQRETKEWESQKSAFSTENYTKNVY